MSSLIRNVSLETGSRKNSCKDEQGVCRLLNEVGDLAPVDTRPRYSVSSLPQSSPKSTIHLRLVKGVTEIYQQCMRTQVGSYLREFNAHKSMRSKRLYLGVQREFAVILTRLLSIIFESSWRSSGST